MPIPGPIEPEQAPLNNAAGSFGPGIGGPGEHHWPADLFIFSKGLERASAQAFFRLYKRVGPEDTSRQAKIFD